MNFLDKAACATDLLADPDQAWSAYVPRPEVPWDVRQAAHLFRRAGFGADSAELDAAVKQGCAQTVDRLLDVGRDGSFDGDMDQAAELIAGSQSPRRLASWWLMRMARTPDPLLEKMTLFWHGHFATSAAKVNNTRAMRAQIDLLRAGAMGPFARLVEGISRDPAMLIYLDSTDNRRTRPNENFARELLELFCLGTGHYTESHVRELARAFTGYEVRRGQFRFNQHQHDAGIKSLLGVSGHFTGEDAIRVILDQPAAAEFLAVKLVRFFVFDEVPITVELVEPLARDLRESDFDIGRIVRRILSSELFFSPLAIGAKIRSPVELAISLLRTLRALTNIGRLSDDLEAMGQLPLYPPNVSGWEGGRAWINAATMLARSNLAYRFANAKDVTLTDGDLAAWAGAVASADADELVQWLIDVWLAVEPPEPVVDDLRAAAEQSRLPQRRVSLLLTMLSALPEFQLC